MTIDEEIIAKMRRRFEKQDQLFNMTNDEKPFQNAVTLFATAHKNEGIDQDQESKLVVRNREGGTHPKRSWAIAILATSLLFVVTVDTVYQRLSLRKVKFSLNSAADQIGQLRQKNDSLSDEMEKEKSESRKQMQLAVEDARLEAVQSIAKTLMNAEQKPIEDLLAETSVLVAQNDAYAKVFLGQLEMATKSTQAPELTVSLLEQYAPQVRRLCEPEEQAYWNERRLFAYRRLDRDQKATELAKQIFDTIESEDLNLRDSRSASIAVLASRQLEDSGEQQAAMDVILPFLSTDVFGELPRSNRLDLLQRKAYALANRGGFKEAAETLDDAIEGGMLYTLAEQAFCHNSYAAYVLNSSQLSADEKTMDLVKDRLETVLKSTAQAVSTSLQVARIEARQMHLAYLETVGSVDSFDNIRELQQELDAFDVPQKVKNALNRSLTGLAIEVGLNESRFNDLPELFAKAEAYKSPAGNSFWDFSIENRELLLRMHLGTLKEEDVLAQIANAKKFPLAKTTDLSALYGTLAGILLQSGELVRAQNAIETAIAFNPQGVLKDRLEVNRILIDQALAGASRSTPAEIIARIPSLDPSILKTDVDNQVAPLNLLDQLSATVFVPQGI